MTRIAEDPALSDAIERRDPVVSTKTRSLPSFLTIGGMVLGGMALFLVLNSHRLAQAAAAPRPPVAAAAVAPPPPLSLPAPLPVAFVQPSPPALPPRPVAVQPSPPAPVEEDLTPRFRAPAVVIDLQPVATMAAAPAVPVSARNAAPAPSSAAESVDPHRQIAAELGQDSTSSSVATQMTDLATTVVQGTTIDAVMETAINSDLPGFARALVSRDVLAFDGRSVLIPRGSRVIGQYRNAISRGQSRVFVIWTRIIRPDGVTVEIGSPGGDQLGQGGLTGEVNSHFFARFGGAILLSVLNAGVAAVSRALITSIAIGSPAAAVDAAAGASAPGAGDIAPTIKVQQGAPVTIFLARDLDFSNVKPLP